MRKSLAFLLAILLAILSALAHADLQADVDFAVKNHTKLQVTGRHVLLAPIVVSDPSNPENTQLVIEGTGEVNQIEGWIDGPLLIWKNPRYSSIKNLVVTNHVSDGIRLEAFATPGHVGSAGNNSFYDVRVQAKGKCWDVFADGGSDFSATSWFNCDVSSGDIGWKFTGSNNLNPTFFGCTGSFLGTMFDFSEGGSCHDVTGGGASHCAVGILCDQGYEGAVRGWTVEDSGTVLKLTSGPGSAYELGLTHVRSTKFLVDSATNNGSLVVSCLRASDNPVVKFTGNGGYCNLQKAAAFLKVSKPVGSTLKVEKSQVGFVPVK